MSGLDRERLNRAVALANQELIAEIGPDGHWVGELSSSALSTATAVTALAVVQRESSTTQHAARIDSGIAWLAHHQNADGGWGDTVLSLSNLSTTTLCWAAFGAVAGADKKHELVLNKAEAWLKQHAGGLEPDCLAPAVIARYGKDRTFSVPILTMCALAGRLGSGSEAWKHVLPLPFELAACPHSWFAALRLPVVSYALPALIAIGQVRHHHRPSRNPFVRMVRDLAREITLRKLTRIQPKNGGFLEATPLTSFVTMSLAGSGRANHAVAKRGVEFLIASQRDDGSWPIDTNLATWVTTLAVNAVGECGMRNAERGLEAGRTALLKQWLLKQQYRSVHPYTYAAPGGWAWTDLPGGVPDADDTAGALLALRKLGPIDEATRQAAIAGVTWLLDVQNRDGGIPTFCKGWGALPFDQSSADITAHTIRAWLAWYNEIPANVQKRIRHSTVRAMDFLKQCQRTDGAWSPLWFGNQHSFEEQNLVYGTARVLPSLVAYEDFATTNTESGRKVYSPSQATVHGTNWLLDSQGKDGSWGGSVESHSSVEETALALDALASLLNPGPLIGDLQKIEFAIVRGINWLIIRIESGEWKQPSPIGFYFAKLWYYERLYPMIFTVGALNRVSQIQTDLH